STAKGVRRHGVRPNRSCNEKVPWSKRDRWRWNRHRVDLNPGAALSWPENRVFRRRFVRKIPTEVVSFVSPPNRSSKASGARQNYKRDLRGIEKCIGSTTGPLLTSTLQSQVKFWDWSKYRGDSAEFSAEVEEKFEKNLRQKG
ncbi:pyrimidine 2, partial [Prunus dulcis]